MYTLETFMGEHIEAKIVERIRKILGRTQEAGCTPAEAEAAFAMASRLLAEHNLTTEEVMKIEGAGSEEAYVTEEFAMSKRWSMEKNYAYAVIKEFYFCEAFLSSRAGGQAFMVFGKPENVAAARHVFVSLLGAFDSKWTTYRIIRKAPATDRRAFIAGMAEGFIAKMRDERRAQQVERDIMAGKTGGTELALASIDGKLKAAFKAAQPTLTKRKSNITGVNGSYSAFADGQAEGRKLNLTRSVEAGASKSITN